MLTGSVTFTGIPQVVNFGSGRGLIVPRICPLLEPNLHSKLLMTVEDGVTEAVNVQRRWLSPPSFFTLQSAVLASRGVTVKSAVGPAVVVVVDDVVDVVDVVLTVVVACAVVVVVVGPGAVVVVVVAPEVVVVVVGPGAVVVVVVGPGAAVVVVVVAPAVVVVVAEFCVGEVLLSQPESSAHTQTTAHTRPRSRATATKPLL